MSDTILDEVIEDTCETTRRRSNRKLYCIEGALLEIYSKQTSLLLNQLELEQHTVLQDPMGSRPLEPRSKETYMKHVRGLRYFAALLGDWESSLMLLEKPPVEYVPSVDPKLLVDFIWWERGETGAPFYRYKSGSQCLDCLGHPVYCQGGWNDPRNVDQFLCAISLLHKSRNYVGIT